eukprot:6214585-Pleurochrysis_carterae.AAC.2
MVGNLHSVVVKHAHRFCWHARKPARVLTQFVPRDWQACRYAQQYLCQQTKRVSEGAKVPQNS